MIFRYFCTSVFYPAKDYQKLTVFTKIWHILWILIPLLKMNFLGYKGVLFSKFFCMVFVLSPRTIFKNYLDPCMPLRLAVGDLRTKIRPKLGHFWAPRATPLQNFVFFFQIMITGIHTVNMIPLLTHFHSWSWKVLQIPLVQKTAIFKITMNFSKNFSKFV